MIRNFFPVALVVASTTATSPALAGGWIVDKAKSHVFFTGVQTGTAFKGEFKRFDAKIDFDPAHADTGHATVMVDVGSAVTGDPQRDEAMPQADWFDVARYPQARFDVKGFRDKGNGRYEAIAALSIRGVSHDVDLPFALTTVGTTAHAIGHLQLMRSAFAVGSGPWASAEWVALEVDVDIDLTAESVP